MMNARADDTLDGKRARRQRRLELIGLDVSGRRRAGRALIGWPVLIAALLLGLGLASLRVDLIRMRYALADALTSERALLEDQRLLTVEMRTLRDPSGLASRARELGFVRPERVIDLPMSPQQTNPGTTPAFAPSETALALGATRP